MSIANLLTDNKYEIKSKDLTVSEGVVADSVEVDKLLVPGPENFLGIAKVPEGYSNSELGSLPTGDFNMALGTLTDTESAPHYFQVDVETGALTKYTCNGLIETERLKVTANTQDIEQQSGKIILGQNAQLQVESASSETLLVQGEQLTFGPVIDLTYVKCSKGDGSRENMVGGFASQAFGVSTGSVIISSPFGNTQANIIWSNATDHAGAVMLLPYEGTNEKFGNVSVWYDDQGSPTNPIVLKACDASYNTSTTDPDYQLLIKDTAGNITKAYTYNLLPNKSIDIKAFWFGNDTRFMICE